MTENQIWFFWGESENHKTPQNTSVDSECASLSVSVCLYTGGYNMVPTPDASVRFSPSPQFTCYLELQNI